MSTHAAPASPNLPRNLTTQFNKNKNDEDAEIEGDDDEDDENEINFNNGRKVATASSLAGIKTNVATSS